MTRPGFMLDACYEKIRHNGNIISCAVLIAIGLNPEGKRTVLGVSCQLSEAELHWREFLESLQKRGLHGVEFIVSDDHAGLKAALQTRFASVPWQRCQFHLQRNAPAFVPKTRTTRRSRPRSARHLQRQRTGRSRTTLKSHRGKTAENRAQTQRLAGKQRA